MWPRNGLLGARLPDWPPTYEVWQTATHCSRPVNANRLVYCCLHIFFAVNSGEPTECQADADPIVASGSVSTDKFGPGLAVSAHRSCRAYLRRHLAAGFPFGGGGGGRRSPSCTGCNILKSQLQPTTLRAFADAFDPLRLASNRSKMAGAKRRKRRPRELRLCPGFGRWWRWSLSSPG